MEHLMEIYSDESNIKFKATTCNLARLKFLRLLKRCPQADYGEILIKSAKDIESPSEYEKYIQWLANPRQKTTASEIINEPELGSIPELAPTHSIIVTESNIDNIPNAKFIHIKNPKYYES